MFSIENLDDFSNKIKLFVFEVFKNALADMNNTSAEELEPDEFITDQESKLIIKDVINSNNEGNWEEVPEELSSKICENINSRIYSNALSRMVNQGFLDCAFCEEHDSFMFSVTEKGKELGVKVCPEKFYDS